MDGEASRAKRRAVDWLSSLADTWLLTLVWLATGKSPSISDVWRTDHADDDGSPE